MARQIEVYLSKSHILGRDGWSWIRASDNRFEFGVFETKSEAISFIIGYDSRYVEVPAPKAEVK